MFFNVVKLCLAILVFIILDTVELVLQSLLAMQVMTEHLALLAMYSL